MKPETKQFLWKMVKTTLVFAAIGGILALSMPYIASMLSLPPVTMTASLVADKAIFFGAFGALSEVLTPAVNFVFDRLAPGSRVENSAISPKEAGKVIAVAKAKAAGVEMAHGHGAGAHHPSVGLLESSQPDVSAQFAAKLEQARLLQEAQPGLNRLQ
jgi:hypothetical protein